MLSIRQGNKNNNNNAANVSGIVYTKKKTKNIFVTNKL